MQQASTITKLRDRPAFPCLLLAVLTLWIYLPVVHYGFLKLWDDDAYVTDNPHVRSGLKLTNISWALTSFEQSNWHPLTWISHMLDCQIFGLNAGGHHAVNLLLHAGNVLLLFWILERATHAVWRSFFVAALFAVHPLNVETVAWIAQRKSLLSVFFSLLALAAYGWYVRKSGWQRYLAIVLAFALALMSKPMAVSLPLAMLLFDYWPLRRLEELRFARRWMRLTVEKLPLFLMSAASSVLTEMAQRSGGSVMTLSLLPVSTRMENAAISCVAYLGKIFWPARLATFYPLRLSPATGDAIASAGILIGVTALALYFRHVRYFLVGWLFFLLTLIPVIGIVQVGFQGMADRYMYVPAVGVFLAVVWGIADLIERATLAPLVAVIAGLCLIAALGAASRRYLDCWRDEVQLFAHARAAWPEPDMWLEQLYGNALFSAGRVDEALAHYQRSCAIQPRTEYCHYNIAHILAGRGHYQQALAQYQLALSFTANPAMAAVCLDESAQVLLRLGEVDAAAKSVSEALKIDPTDSTALRLRDQIAHAANAAH
jgi:hypothetical protein